VNFNEENEKRLQQELRELMNQRARLQEGIDEFENRYVFS
jgi:hypothetical protein